MQNWRKGIETEMLCVKLELKELIFVKKKKKKKYEMDRLIKFRRFQF